MNRLLCHLRRAALISANSGPSDAQLLEAFLSRHDEAAFEALVRRHGPMVHSVCRRVVGNIHDADDAFQATFIVLVRKAASLRKRHLLASWLYGVAFRTALKARAMSHKRRAKEKQAAQQPLLNTAAESVPEELLARLDEELNRLPERYRLPVVLCELQGHSRKQAARLLGLPEGTLSSRLAQARKLLAQRLAPYGTMLSAGAVAALLAEGARSAAVPASLIQATIGVGMQLLPGQMLATGAVPVAVHALSEGVLKAMLLSKLKLVCGLVLVLAAGAIAVGWTYRPVFAADPKQPTSARTARIADDEIEELRLEVAALRKGLQATRERVRSLQAQVEALQARTPLASGAYVDPKGAGPRSIDFVAPGGVPDKLSADRGAMTGPKVPRSADIAPSMQPRRPRDVLQGAPDTGGSGDGLSAPAKQSADSAGPSAKQASSAQIQMQRMMQMMAGRRDAGKADPNAPPKQPDWGADKLLPQSNSMKRPSNSLRKLDDGKMLGMDRNARDPLTRAEHALQRLRQHPDDKHAANELQRGLELLRLQQDKGQLPRTR